MKSEKQIEKYLIKKIKEIDGLCLKWTSPGTAGVPDRIVLTAWGEVYFVELKAEGKRNNLSKVQKVFFEKLRQMCYEVYVLASYKDVDDFIRDVML